MAITERTTNMIFNGGFLCQVSMRPKLGIHQVKNNKWAWQCIENLVPDRKNCWTEKQQSNPVPKFQVFMEQSSADKCDDSMGFELSKDFIKLLYDMFGWVFLGCRESFCRTPFYSLMLQLVQWEVPWRKQQCFVFSLCKLPTSTRLEKKKKNKHGACGDIWKAKKAVPKDNCNTAWWLTVHLAIPTLWWLLKEFVWLLAARDVWGSHTLETMPFECRPSATGVCLKKMVGVYFLGHAVSLFICWLFFFF